MESVASFRLATLFPPFRFYPANKGNYSIKKTTFHVSGLYLDFVLLVASRPTIVDDFLRGDAGASVISPAGLPLSSFVLRTLEDKARRRQNARTQLPRAAALFRHSHSTARARSGRKKQGLAPSGRQRRSGPLGEARFRPLRAKIAPHRRLCSKQNYFSLANFPPT